MPTFRVLLVVAMAVTSACKDDSEDKGTCLKSIGTVEYCTVNEPRYQCSGKDAQFFVGEKAAAGVAHCRSLGYLKNSNMATPMNGSAYRIDRPGSESYELQQALDKGDSVFFTKPQR